MLTLLAMKGRFPRGIQKYIRQEKARIRREFFRPKEQGEHIQKLYKKFSYMEAQPKEKKAEKKEEA